ncbi:MAG: ATP-dependent RNA helicase HrpA, partial [Planctomycetes bacterium]|nr:ATP-dependent RNA helicase HrpA [Planctomycetota bacterium]
MSARDKSGERGAEGQRFSKDIDLCMLTDRQRLREKLRRLHRGKAGGVEYEKFSGELREAMARRSERAQNLPKPVYPEELPVTQKRDAIAEAVKNNQVLIVAGETGSGKTTQLPKICLDLGRGADGMIACTQPRRIAAISVAGRVADELETSVGDTVGYQIRFDAKVKDSTYIKFMTDGILLAETRKDRDLCAYDTIIIDEAHERSLNIDFLLGYVKRLLPRRPDLKVIVSSATLDVERFSKYFGDAPVVSVEGRTYPVDLRYRPDEDDDPDMPVLVGRAVVELMAEDERGDILVFLSGERDIRETADHLTRQRLKRCEILPLFGRLTAEEQKRIFSRGKNRRIVLSTNVAETSLTVPGIRYVIDTGLARIKRYTHRTQVEQLLVERVSKASANQRMGRCGRMEPGICIRLYSEEDYSGREDYTDPEIMRSSLASVILQMKYMGLGDVEKFPFIEPPTPAMIRTGYNELFELDALDERKNLTPAGTQMARMPIEPRFARMLLEGAKENALSDILIIVAGLSIQDPRERPMDKKDQADQLHRRYLDDKSDFTSWLNLWHVFTRESERQPSNNQIRKWCKQNLLSYRRMREWADVRAQLEGEMSKLKYKLNTKSASFEQVHKALLAGLLSRMGIVTDKKEYRGARETRFHIWPGSGLFKRLPKWIMASELVETSRLFGRCVGEINPEWAEKLAGSIAKRTYSDPHWDPKSLIARAFEAVTVYGLPVIEKRRIHYGKIDPEKSRELMILFGLVRGEFRTRMAFFHHNRELVGKFEEMEDKSRRGGIVVDEELLFEFYNSRIPKDIYTGKALERWYHEKVKEDRGLLMMNEGDVAVESVSGLTADRFPPEIQVGKVRLPLSYK